MLCHSYRHGMFDSKHFTVIVKDFLLLNLIVNHILVRRMRGENHFYLMSHFMYSGIFVRFIINDGEEDVPFLFNIVDF